MSGINTILISSVYLGSVLAAGEMLLLLPGEDALQLLLGLPLRPARPPPQPLQPVDAEVCGARGGAGEQELGRPVPAAAAQRAAAAQVKRTAAAPAE